MAQVCTQVQVTDWWNEPQSIPKWKHWSGAVTPSNERFTWQVSGASFRITEERKYLVLNRGGP